MRFIRDMHPTLRGLLIVALIAGLIVVLNLGIALASLFLIARIAFLIVIAIWVYSWWREHRSEISEMPGRVQAVLYLGAGLVLVDFAVYFVRRPSGADALAFFLVLIFSGYAMWRAWRDQHRYS